MKITEFTSQLDSLLCNYDEAPNETQSIDNRVNALVSDFLKENTPEEIPFDANLGNRIQAILPRFESNPVVHQALENFAEGLCWCAEDPFSHLPTELTASIFAFANSSSIKYVLTHWKRISYEEKIRKINTERIAFKDLANEDLTLMEVQGLVDFICRAGKKIHYLNLAGIPITDEQLKQILTACSKITHLELDSSDLTNYIQISAQKSLKELAIINHFELAHFPLVDFSSLEYLKLAQFDLSSLEFARNFKQLKNLSLSLSLLPDSFFDQLVALESLRSLELNRLPLIGFLQKDNNLNKLKKLEELSLTSVRLKNKNIINQISNLTNLKLLNYETCHILVSGERTDLISFPNLDRLVNLESLRLCNFGERNQLPNFIFLGKDNLNSLELECYNIEILPQNLENLKLKNCGLANLEVMKNLENVNTLEIDSTILNQMIATNTSSEKFEKITIIDSIDTQDSEAVTQFLEKAGPRVTQLDLTDKIFTPSQIARILKNCNQIESLKFTKEDVNVEDEG